MTETRHEKEIDCKYCYDKRYYSVIFGIHGSEDMGGDGFDSLPQIYNIACPKYGYMISGTSN